MKTLNRPTIALLCGVPPTCDRCAVEDAKVAVTLPTFGQRVLCEQCIVLLVERGLDDTHWPGTTTNFLVVDNEFNRENGYSDLIGKIFATPPSYCAVECVECVNMPANQP